MRGGVNAADNLINLPVEFWNPERELRLRVGLKPMRVPLPTKNGPMGPRIEIFLKKQTGPNVTPGQTVNSTQRSR
jgi:hypothetical protein